MVPDAYAGVEAVSKSEIPRARPGAYVRIGPPISGAPDWVKAAVPKGCEMIGAVVTEDGASVCYQKMAKPGAVPADRYHTVTVRRP